IGRRIQQIYGWKFILYPRHFFGFVFILPVKFSGTCLFITLAHIYGDINIVFLFSNLPFFNIGTGSLIQRLHLLLLLEPAFAVLLLRPFHNFINRLGRLLFSFFSRRLLSLFAWNLLFARGFPRLPAQLLFGLLFRSEEHTSELQSRFDLVCRLLLEKKKNN